MRYLAISILLFSCFSTLDAYAPKAKKKNEHPQLDPNHKITPTARTCPKSSGPYLIGSYLYWKPQIDNIPIVAKYTFLGNPPNDYVTVKRMDFDWESGFKVGFGYNIKRDRWDFRLNWTELHSLMHETFQTGLSYNGPISPIPGFLAVLSDTVGTGTEALFVFCMQAKTKWDLDFDTLDFEVGRDFFISSNLSLRPFAGLKAAKIDQRFKVEYFDNFELDSNIVNPILFDYSKTTAKQDHDAIGPRIGINTRWNIASFNLAFDANAAFSLLWSKLEAQTKGQIPSHDIIDSVIDNKTFMEPVFEIFLGFDWRHCWRWFGLNISAGYEMQYWLNETQMFETVQNSHIPSNTDLTLQGLTASLKLEF